MDQRCSRSKRSRLIEKRKTLNFPGTGPILRPTFYFLEYSSTHDPSNFDKTFDRANTRVHVAQIVFRLTPSEQLAS
jgi:hypothetical protein